MTYLNVNIDHIATLRNARGGIEPNLIFATQIIESCGVAGIVMHLRKNRKHIKDKDV